VNVLLIGSGGREHALAWKTAQSPRLQHLWVAPGNAGTAGDARASGDPQATRDAPRGRLSKSETPVENVPIQAGDAPALAAFARANDIDLVIVGPEGPLAAGLADALRADGIRVFGPSAAAAQIEASKAFAKAFMARHGLASARYAVCDSFESARAYLRTAEFPVVIKASGLAAGKGVILPDSHAEAEDVLRRILLQGEFGAAGDQVVIEERLAGPEVSLLAFSDGVNVRPMPPAQDHKNLFDGDRGPNTGGMGAYAPAPICPPEIVAELTRRILQPAVDGLREEHRPFIGVLYAGLMLTGDGPRVLEFNCRFGDPETQAILPLLETDLLDIATACAEGGLAGVDIRWKPGAAACVVMASEGYPGASPVGRPIHGLDGSFENAIVFHAGTKVANGGVVTAGGRVLGMTGWGGDLPAALANAYAAVEHIHFEGQHYRRDIGHRALEAQP
jgi:phosphoribosylamine--glycine ligase